MKRLFLTSTIVVLVAMLLSISLPIVPRSSYAQAPEPAQVTSAETPRPSAPEQLTQDNSKPGVYFIDAGGVEFDPAVYPVDGAIRFYGWSALNPSKNSYRWTDLDDYIAKRKSQGLETGIMLTTYDGMTSGDIRSTPNYVIKIPNAVIPAWNNDASKTPSYASYWRSGAFNPNFDWNPSSYSWSLAGEASIVPEPTGASGNAARLGGKINSTGSASHSAQRIPAMPASLNGTLTSYVDFRVYISTTDTNANDHLYAELWDSSNNQIGSARMDISNLSHPSNTWQSYRFDISSVAHEQSPRVTFRVVNDGAEPTTFYVDDAYLFVRHLIPNYESPDYIAAYGDFIKALGDRYKTNTDLEFVAIGTGLFGENQPVQYNFQHVTTSLTSDDWVKYIKDVTAKYVNAFTISGIPGPARSLLTQAAPTYLANMERKYVTDYAAGLGAGISLNFLSPDWTYSYRNDLAGFYDPTYAWWRNVPIAYESYMMDLCNPVMVSYALANGLDKRVDYLRVDSGLLKDGKGNPITANVELYKWAREYVGKNAETTPRVWTFMNEHRNPTLGNCRPGGLSYLAKDGGNRYPHLGNFNFFLRQVDGIPGGQTIPETNDKGADSRYAKNPDTGALWPDAGLGNCPAAGYRQDLFGPNYPCNKTPYNPLLPALGGQNLNDYRQYYNVDDWTGEGKEAYVVRRTDQNVDPAKNNPFMFFMVDNGYIDGKQVYKAKITVQYFDIGTDSWSLKYDSTSGEKVAGTIAKTNSKKLMTAEFTVTDAKFANRLTGATDFFIDSRNPADNSLDGNEWVHMVMVEKLDSSTEPPTPTPTPTITPTATPSTGAVEGIAFHDANANGKLDAGEAGVAGAVLSLSDLLVQDKYTATSLADGKYRFAAVDPGQYTLKEKTAPPGFFKNSTFAIVIPVQANQTWSTGTNVGHERDSAALNNKTYLPVILR